MTNEQIKYVDLNQSDMVMILGALLTIKSTIPDSLEHEPEMVQLRAAQLVHLIQRFREALKVPDDVWAEFGTMFAALKQGDNGSQRH